MTAGLGTHLGSVHGATGWLLGLAVLAAAALGKSVGTVVPARLTDRRGGTPHGSAR
jgi:hypothetical protein